MNDRCPICKSKADAEKVYENTQGYTNETGKYVIKQGGKQAGRVVGASLGSMFGVAELGAELGGYAGSFLAGAGADKYANSHGSFHYKYSHCGLSWTADSDEFRLVHSYWKNKELQIKSFNGHGIWPLIGMTFFPYLFLILLLLLCVMIKIALFLFLLNNHPVEWAWNILSWWAIHTWTYHLGLIMLIIIISPFSHAHEKRKFRKNRLEFFCKKYGLHIDSKEYEDGTYNGTMTSDGIRFGYGTFKQKNGNEVSGPWRNDKMEVY